MLVSNYSNSGFDVKFDLTVNNQVFSLSSNCLFLSGVHYLYDLVEFLDMAVGGQEFISMGVAIVTLHTKEGDKHYLLTSLGSDECDSENLIDQLCNMFNQEALLYV